MTLEQLRIFVAVADKQHVTKAASELNLTQSATSAAIWSSAHTSKLRGCTGISSTSATVRASTRNDLTGYR